MISALLNLLYIEWYTGIQCVSCVAIFQVSWVVSTTNGEDVGMVRNTTITVCCSRGLFYTMIFYVFMISLRTRLFGSDVQIGSGQEGR